MKEAVIELYRKTYGEKPRFLVRSPGRVNLIGEHTDYNEGFVLPLAIERAVWLAFSPSRDRTVTLHAHDFGETASFELDGFLRAGAGWLEYIKGVAFSLSETGHRLAGWKGCIMSDLPVGAGLSSSAALETGTVAAFSAVSNLTISPRDKALLAQRAENEWVGMNCGIMDQMASACGVKSSALLIDCRSLDLQPVPLPENSLIAVLDTSTRRRLVESEYNSRRTQCETAARSLGVAYLRDVSPERLSAVSDPPDQTIHNRALHVVSENRRVLDCVACLKRGDTAGAGRLLIDSHNSLRDLYDVSSTALDQIVAAALESGECYGARMTGAGFGGCAVALIRGDCAAQFTAAVKDRYHARSGLDAAVYITQAADGTETVEIG